MTVLGLEEALKELAATWAGDAKTLRRYDPDSAPARYLDRCAQDLEEALWRLLPEWVSSNVIRDRTGWSSSKLRKILKELEQSGDARKDGPHWKVRREAALAIPVRRTRDPLPGEDLATMARRLGREGDTRGPNG